MNPTVERYLPQFKVHPYQHQITGVEKLLKVPTVALFDEMGVGKSKQVLDASTILWHEQKVQLVVVVCPAFLKRNWYHPDYGEIQKQVWTPHVVYHFHNKGLVPVYETTKVKPRLAFVVTNYEYLRQKKAQEALAAIIKPRRTSLVLDESSFIKSYR